MATQFWFVRHAQSAANAGLKTSDPATIPITSLGQGQSIKLAEEIVVAPDLIVMSPFLRTQQTAQATLKKFPALATEIWPIQEFTYLNPERNQNSSMAERRPKVEAYWKRADPDYNDGGSAESFHEVMRRVDTMWGRLTRDHQSKTVLVFGHGMFIKMLEWKLQNSGDLSMEGFRAFHEAAAMPNCSILKCQINKNKSWRLEW